ncbi:hypothetical protein [Pseudogemmobacter blasticus]|uniref:hypothetical protein n=1 Tax=Fuscovulum blasticum TaxID=1075 RepID=UPI001F16BF51|nr:hypothetical protein [Fuscovulum blasticum]
MADLLSRRRRSRNHARTTIAAAITTLFASPALAEDQTTIINRDGLTLRWHFQAGLNAVSEENLFWDLSATTAPGSTFDPDTNWLEGYIKPGLSFDYRLESGAVIYGKLSVVSSYTMGTDAFDTGDTGATTLEEAYLAIRGDLNGGLSYDFSLGPRELTLGTGMLIANGASSGFDRGALKLGPRKAWERAAIGRLAFGTVTGTVFYLDPNELPANDSGNKLAGIDLRQDGPNGGYLGATFVDVLNSGSPYPQAGSGGAAPTIIPGGREGTKTINLYAKTNPFAGTMENWVFAGDFAYQWNDRIDLES